MSNGWKLIADSYDKKTKIMKLILLIILLCGVSSATDNKAKAKKVCNAYQKTTSTIDLVPSGLLFEL